MNHRLFLPLAISVLVLAGCYRQASDSFEQVDSQNVQSIESPTALPITPTLDETAIEAMSGDETDQPSTVPSKTPDPNDPDPTDIPVTSTIIVRNTAQPPLVPTATNPVFRTPEPPPGQVVQPTINPPTATATFDIVPPTPTDVADGVQATDECVHEVVSGDNLFRIAINNGTTVEAIMQLNSLENDAIQIEQLLRIPGCVPGQADDDDDDDSTTTVTRPTATSSVGGSSVATLEPAGGLPSAGEQIHVVASGETLGGIARRYGLTIADIVEANNLTNPNALSIGQELLIPAGS